MKNCNQIFSLSSLRLVRYATFISFPYSKQRLKASNACVLQGHLLLVKYFSLFLNLALLSTSLLQKCSSVSDQRLKRDKHVSPKIIHHPPILGVGIPYLSHDIFDMLIFNRYKGYPYQTIFYKKDYPFQLFLQAAS